MFQARYYKDFAPTERAWPPTNVQTPAGVASGAPTAPRATFRESRGSIRDEAPRETFRLLALAWIEGVTQSVSQKIESNERQRHGDCWKNQKPPIAFDRVDHLHRVA